MITAFLLCRRCRLLHPLGPPGPWREAGDAAVAAELEEFRAAHAGHGLEEAERVDERTVVDGPLWDPMATRWFHVAVGTEQLAVRSWRPSIESERRNELAGGEPPTTSTSVDIDERFLRRALDRHFYPHVIRSAQIDAVLTTVRELVAPLDPHQVKTLFDDPSLPDAAIGPFPPPLCEALLDRCHSLFDGQQLERLRDFVTGHSGSDGALALRVHRTVAPRAA